MPIIDPFSPVETERRNREVAEQIKGIEFPVGEMVLVGWTETTNLVTVGMRHSADSEPWLWFLTDCCGAAAKGMDSGICCKGCYELVSSDYGDIYDPRWHGPIVRDDVNPDPEVRRIFKKGSTPRG